MAAPSLYPVYAINGILGRECSKCHVWKPVAEFHKCSKEKTGILNCCKECKRSVYGTRQTAKGYWKDYYAANRDRRKAESQAWWWDNHPYALERGRRYYIDNHDRIRERGRQYRRDHAAESYARNKEWRAANRAQRNAQDRAWRAANREKSNGYGAKYRANNRLKRRVLNHKRRTAEGFFTEADLAAILTAQDGRCYYCGIVLVEHHVEHMTPIIRGGTNWPANLCFSCPLCNARKGTLTAKEFMERLANNTI